MKWLLAVGACLVLSTHAASIAKRDAATSEFKRELFLMVTFFYWLFYPKKCHFAVIGDAFRLWSGEELVQVSA